MQTKKPLYQQLQVHTLIKTFRHTLKIIVLLKKKKKKLTKYPEAKLYEKRYNWVEKDFTF